MFLAIWTIAVVRISLLAVGIPMGWLIGGRKPLDESAWIQVPFLGLGDFLQRYYHTIPPQMIPLLF
jgi:hypothetical protein